MNKQIKHDLSSFVPYSWKLCVICKTPIYRKFGYPAVFSHEECFVNPIANGAKWIHWLAIEIEEISSRAQGKKLKNPEAI